MRVGATVKTADLKIALTALKRVAQNKISLPVLHHVLLEASGTTLKLSACNLEVYLTLGMAAEVTGEWSVTAECATLHGVASKLKDNEVTLFPESDGGVFLASGKANLTFEGLKADEFPLKGTDGGYVTGAILMRAGDLYRAIDRTNWAAAKDESRPILTCLNIGNTRRGVRFEAADGFRLVLEEVEAVVEAADEDGTVWDVLGKGVLVSASSYKLVAQAMGSKVTGDASITVYDNRLVIEWEGGAVYMQRVEGSFPDVERLIPRSDAKNRVLAILPRKAWQEAADILGVFVKDGANITRLVSEDGVVSLTSGGGKQRIVVDGAESDGDFGVALNFKYQLDALKTLDCDSVLVNAGKPDVPVLIECEDGTSRHVIMPMHIGSNNE